MEKEFLYQESLKRMNETERQEAIRKHEENIKKHNNHSRVHHPGSKQQLEEVWQNGDHMPKEEFNPKTFFALHDVNGDGFLDSDELEALLTLEIKKMYDPNNPEDDPNEMEEEFHRMRAEILREADKNKDGFISRKEFLDHTAGVDFTRDEEWKGIEEQQIYTPEELRRYEQQRAELLKHQYQYYADPAAFGLPPLNDPNVQYQIVPHPAQIQMQQQMYQHQPNQFIHDPNMQSYQFQQVNQPHLVQPQFGQPAPYGQQVDQKPQFPQQPQQYHLPHYQQPQHQQPQQFQQPQQHQQPQQFQQPQAGSHPTIVSNSSQQISSNSPH